jgi:hypothetical protein
MPPVISPPVEEIGRAADVGYSTGLGGLQPWSAWVDTREFVPELRFPQSVASYEKMRTDAQLAALFWAVTSPIRRYKFVIQENGARPEAVSAVAEDLGLDIAGQEPRPRGRRAGKFSHDQHLQHCLLSLIFGFGFFEQVGRIENGMWRLTKLMSLPQPSISEINVAPDGGLVYVKQKWVSPRTPWGETPEIPVDRLVAYVWEKENANWTGRSMFRDCYRNWLIKDRLLRVDAINHERAGGVPWAEAAPGASPKDIQRLSEMAQQFKVGEEAGGAVPPGAKLNIARLGAGTDVINSIHYHDESMARRFMQMVIQLGQTQTGSRALGHEFTELASMAQRAVAQWYVDITNEHVIEDWMDWNYGPEEQFCPLLDYVIEDEDEYLPVQDLVAMVEKGVITVDPELEEYMRHRFRMPEKDASEIPQLRPETPIDPGLTQAIVEGINEWITTQSSDSSARLPAEAVR